MPRGRGSKSKFALRRRIIRSQYPYRPKILIITEGATEEVYFNNFRTSTGPDVIVKDKSDSKRSLVQKAVDHRAILIEAKDYLESDETWVVFDRDVSKVNRKDKTLFNEALSLAQANDINVAYSNDSFELWFLMHFRDVSTEMHRTTIIKKLKEDLGGKYKKAVNIYPSIKGMTTTAIARAERNLQTFSKSETPPIDANPSTTVHKLVKRLLDAQNI